MGQRAILSIRVRSAIVLAGGGLLWAACGETEKNSEAEPATKNPSGGSGGGSTSSSDTDTSASANSGGTGDSGSATPTTASATTTTGSVEPGTGGASTMNATTDQGAAGADPASTVGTTGTVEPDDGCEVDPWRVDDVSCQFTTTCPGFVQHTNCRSTSSERWQCDTDEHDSSKPQTPDNNPGWFNTVTGTATATEACDAVVAVNLKRPSVTPVSATDCSEFTTESAYEVGRTRICGQSYQTNSGVIVWKEQPASAYCSTDGDGLSCSCTGLGTDDGNYELDAPDLESALADVWEFCTNSSPAVPVEMGACDPVYITSTGDGSCYFINNCPLVVMDETGFELEETVYQEIICGLDDDDTSLGCTCRLGAVPQLSFRATVGEAPGESACESLADACDPRNTLERADGPAECERLSELVGHDSWSQSYSCSVPISLGGSDGFALEYGSLGCSRASGGWLSCTCHESFSNTNTTIEPATADLDLAWEEAVSLCKGHLEAPPEL